MTIDSSGSASSCDTAAHSNTRLARVANFPGPTGPGPWLDSGAPAPLVVSLVVGFQLPGLGLDGLLSDASALRGNALWRGDFATVWAGTTDYARYFAPWAAFVQRALRAGTLPLWNPYVGTGVPVSEALQPALFHPFTLVLVALPVEH